MRVISTTSEQTATCPRGTVFAYMPADVTRSLVAVPLDAEAERFVGAVLGETVIGEYVEARSVTCPCCFARCEVVT